jgi:hypothetical protein
LELEAWRDLARRYLAVFRSEWALGLHVAREADTDLWPKKEKGCGGLVFLGILRLRLAQSAAPNFAQDDGFLERWILRRFRTADFATIADFSTDRQLRQIFFMSLQLVRLLARLGGFGVVQG